MSNTESWAFSSMDLAHCAGYLTRHTDKNETQERGVYTPSPPAYIWTTENMSTATSIYYSSYHPERCHWTCWWLIPPVPLSTYYQIAWQWRSKELLFQWRNQQLQGLIEAAVSTIRYSTRRNSCSTFWKKEQRQIGSMIMNSHLIPLSAGLSWRQLYVYLYLH